MNKVGENMRDVAINKGIAPGHRIVRSGTFVQDLLRSVSGAMLGSMACVTTEGASVGAMAVIRGICHAGTSSIEDEADVLVVHGLESVGPHNNERTFRSTASFAEQTLALFPLVPQ